MTLNPESRLLDLIRKKSRPSWKEKWVSRFEPFFRWKNVRFKMDSADLWPWTNTCLSLLLLGTLIYGGFLFLRRESPVPEPSGSRRVFLESHLNRREPATSDLAGRDLFKDMAPPPPPVPLEIHAEPPAPPKVPLSQRASRFRLVGILPGESPQAIIEDTQSQRMIYATQGQRIDGILVESVTAGKVVLSDGAERFDILL